ncbi:hypothetical protein BDZ97DRAFT_1752835 [Flammula alnicola]|nr:hypothetical protein BDZ97DRAFT_1752835 [Flammula alnicola]
MAPEDGLVDTDLGGGHTNDILLSLSALELANSAAAISKLPGDLLWRIFLVNTNMEDDEKKPDGRNRTASENDPDYLKFHALTATRWSSQVCRLWRHLILASSSLWGKVIDLDILTECHDNWRKEVTRRSGGAALWIKGTVNGQSPVSLAFFVQLLNEHWSRTRVIRVLVESGEYIPAETWDILKRPARDLEVFHLKLRLRIRNTLASCPSFRPMQ